MKITLLQLSQSLNKQLSSVYFLSGDETLLVEEAAASVRQAAHNNEITERDIFHIEKGFAWQSLLSTSKNFSLFADKKLIELHLTSAKIEPAGTKILENYFLNPPADKILLIIAPKLEAGWQKIKWLKIIEEKYIFLQIWPIETHQLPYWIEQRMKTKGLIASKEACKVLAEKVEGNLLAAAQEIEKLSLLYNKQTIEAGNIIEAVTDSSHYNIFALVDAALKNDLKKVVSIITNLQAEGVEPILVLWLLSREIRKYTPYGFETMLKQAAKIDAIIKGVASGNVWTELLQLSLKLAKATKNLCA